MYRLLLLLVLTAGVPAAPRRNPDGDPGASPVTSGGPGRVQPEPRQAELRHPPAPEPNPWTSGCEPSHATGLPSGAVAVIHRATCPLVVKVQDAYAAGVSAVLTVTKFGRSDR